MQTIATAPNTAELLELAMQYWSIAAASLLILVWVMAMLIAKKKIPWWIPAMLCVVMLAANFVLEGIPQPVMAFMRF